MKLQESERLQQLRSDQRGFLGREEISGISDLSYYEAFDIEGSGDLELVTSVGDDGVNLYVCKKNGKPRTGEQPPELRDIVAVTHPSHLQSRDVCHLPHRLFETRREFQGRGLAQFLFDTVVDIEAERPVGDTTPSPSQVGLFEKNGYRPWIVYANQRQYILSSAEEVAAMKQIVLGTREKMAGFSGNVFLPCTIQMADAQSEEFALEGIPESVPENVVAGVKAKIERELGIPDLTHLVEDNAGFFSIQ